MVDAKRYSLVTDPEIVGKDEFAIRKHSDELGGCAIIVKRGILNGQFTEEEKMDYVLTLINKFGI